MASKDEKTDPGLFGRLRGFRDTGMDVWAQAAILATRSPAYQWSTGLLARPMLRVLGTLRKAREAAMARVLAQLNLPSRDDVLALSGRLTQIEMVLDDVSADVHDARVAASRAAEMTPEKAAEATPERATRAAAHEPRPAARRTPRGASQTRQPNGNAASSPRSAAAPASPAGKET